MMLYESEGCMAWASERCEAWSEEKPQVEDQIVSQIGGEESGEAER